MRKRTINSTLSVMKNGKWENFKSNPELRARLMRAIEDYDEQITYINDPKNNMSPSNKGFERNVLIDHIEMILEYTLKHS